MPSRTVPFFNYPHVYLSHRDEYLKIMDDVCSRGAFIQQRDLIEFERSLAEYNRVKYALGVANGTDALIMSLLAAGVGRGDEVIFCSHTFVATAAAIHHASATPVPAEVGNDHLIDPKSVEEKITPRTRAIMPTQLNGRVADMDALQAIATRHNLLIIEDSAQGMGAKYKGRFSGTFGMAGTISYYPAKNLGAFGDGGAIFTNDDQMYEELLCLRDHGRGPNGEVRRWGFNSRLDNLQAAILHAKFKRYDQEVARRRAIASIYQSLLGDVKELKLPPPPCSEPDRFDVFQNYELLAERRDDLRDFLKENGVGTLIQWGGKAVHQFNDLGLNTHLPYTDWFFTRCIMFPMNTSLSDDDVVYVCAKVCEFYGYR
jgi:dTDP-4-amino-4,6-dideoxygalactose transaminase